jgi:hypothetical protein
MGTFLRANRDEQKSIQLPASKKLDAGRLRIVGADDSASMAGKLLGDDKQAVRNLPRSKAAGSADDRLEKSFGQAEAETKTLPSREPGVDLTMLQPDGVDTTKLSAFLHDTPAPSRNRKQVVHDSTGRKAVGMPVAKTDLLEIFKSDAVCMVARQPSNAPTLDGNSPADKMPTAAVCATVPAQKTPPLLDKTQQYIVDNWPKLPPHVQAAILNVIDAAIAPDDE